MYTYTDKSQNWDSWQVKWVTLLILLWLNVLLGHRTPILIWMLLWHLSPTYATVLPYNRTRQQLSLQKLIRKASRNTAKTLRWSSILPTIQIRITDHCYQNTLEADTLGHPQMFFDCTLTGQSSFSHLRWTYSILVIIWGWWEYLFTCPRAQTKHWPADENKVQHIVI